jgi:hypothetical protein
MEGKVVELDVREDVKNNLEPFQKIMAAVADLNKNDIFILHAPMKPVPLYTVMKAKGFDFNSEELDVKHWKVIFRKN